MTSRRNLITAVLCAVAGSTAATGLATAITSAPAFAWPGPYVTVAADGSADFTSVQAAVDAVLGQHRPVHHQAQGPGSTAGR